MERKIIYLINPISGTSKKERIRDLVERETAFQQIPFKVMQTNSAGDYETLKELIQEEQYTDVVMMGGDGTVNQVTDSLRSTGVRFGIIPVGSGNGLARAANIPTKPKAALALIFEGKASAVDAFTINGAYSCMLSGVGFDAQVAHDFAQKSIRGLLAYTQQSIIQFFKANPYQFEVILEQFSFFTDAFFISIANSNQFGNNATIAPQASLSDGMLDIVIVQKMNKAKLPFAILRQMRGNNKLQQLVEDMSNKNILYFQTPSLTIKNPKLAPLHIDGEPKETTEELNINIIKDAFLLIRP
ncbi:MAG: YegS/Rv2252/BmrU family lipid kinase [Sphingobacteriia bacterium]|jgi:diacylglycerol kinase (ATP)|nr:MAG: YegS/Rv2252/BmrU family lipid kinase [Sphingobacteriia bacterium]TAG31321.1 MAG: YegS/Rv2252/BmrU family lipid kinase [Sphingobacteriia bacterium]TAH07048.1 MAG: YegS/Rv2252/BmrU family lipid kinase [Sphingobacteriia bacterium]